MADIHIDIVDKKGKKADTMSVPVEIFGVEGNDALVHQVYTIKRSNQRRPYAHTKTRADVRGGGQKPWRQKGTGRARHGSRRSPIWVGGGITFGPRSERNFAKKVNTKMNRKAIAVVLSSKVRDKTVTVVDSLEFENPSTKQAVALLDALKKNNQSSIVFGTKQDNNFIKSFRNIQRIKPQSVNRINIVDLLHHKNCIFSQAGLQILIDTYADSNQHTAKGRKVAKAA